MDDLFTLPDKKISQVPGGDGKMDLAESMLSFETHLTRWVQVTSGHEWKKKFVPIAHSMLIVGIIVSGYRWSLVGFDDVTMHHPTTSCDFGNIPRLEPKSAMDKSSHHWDNKLISRATSAFKYEICSAYFWNLAAASAFFEICSLHARSHRESRLRGHF